MPEDPERYAGTDLVERNEGSTHPFKRDHEINEVMVLGIRMEVVYIGIGDW